MKPRKKCLKMKIFYRFYHIMCHSKHHNGRMVRAPTMWAHMPWAASPWFNSRLARPFAACHSPALSPCCISCLSLLSLSNKGTKCQKKEVFSHSAIIIYSISIYSHLLMWQRSGGGVWQVHSFSLAKWHHCLTVNYYFLLHGDLWTHCDGHD